MENKKIEDMYITGGIELLQGVVEDKNVCVLGSLPPKDFKPDLYDVVIRCNDHWVIDQGRCDVLFHIGASPMIKMSWLIQATCLEANLKLLCLYRDGGESKRIQRIAFFHKLSVMLHDEGFEPTQRMRKYFNIRGHSPSTGMNAVYMTLLCNPNKLHFTGADLYASDPTHIGWQKHGGVDHAKWFLHLLEKYHSFSVGDDVMKGIEYWRALDESCSIK